MIQPPSALERRRFTRQFSMTLANLSHVEIWFLPSSRQITARATPPLLKRNHERKFALPRNARFVGEYAHPCKAADFLTDLDDTIAKIRFDLDARQQRRIAAAASA